MPGFFVGAGFFDLSSLNDRLRARGYERLTGLIPVIGGELRAIHDNGFVMGAYGAAILDKTGDGPGGLQTSWGGGFGLLDLGYAPVHSRSFTVSVSGGIGGYGLTLDVADTRDTTFGEVLDMPRRGTSLTRGGVLFGLMLRVDGRIPIGEVRNERQGYIALGLRVNGLLGVAVGDWSFANDGDDDADGGPLGTLTGVYAALVIGWGNTAGTPEL